VILGSRNFTGNIIGVQASLTCDVPLKPTKKGVSSGTSHGRFTTFITALTLSAITLLAFSSSFHAGFAWDNQCLILKDPRLRAANHETSGSSSSIRIGGRPARLVSIVR
jgi:hypothetical protein